MTDKNEPMTQDFMNELLESISMDFRLNDKDGELPYAYVNPASDGRVKWICNNDEEGRITSVFAFQNGKETDRKVQYLDSPQQAKEVLAELVLDGWQPIEPPKVTISAPGGRKVSAREMKRQLEKKARQFEKAEKKREKKDE